MCGEGTGGGYGESKKTPKAERKGEGGPMNSYDKKNGMIDSEGYL